MSDQTARWTVVYRTNVGSPNPTIDMVSANEPSLAQVQAVDKAATSIASAKELHRSVYRVSYNVRGNSQQKQANIAAFDPQEASSHVGEVDNISVANVVSDVYVAGVDKQFAYKFKPAPKPVAPVVAPVAAPPTPPVNEVK